jgi:hypothetical protein
MTIDITLNPIGRSFIPTVLQHQRFRNTGFLRGDSAVGYHWVVLDPRRHPLYVWKEQFHLSHVLEEEHYQQTAFGLNAAAFSNGPMMEYPRFMDLVKTLLKKIGAWTLAAVLGATIVAGLITGGLGLPVLVAALAAGGSGIVAGIIRAILDWTRGGVPFGFVKGDRHWVDDAGMGYNGELVSFGRGSTTAFSSYSLTRGHAPAGYEEGIGGLIALVIGYAAQTATAGPNYNKPFSDLSAKGGIASWALIPLGDTSTTSHAAIPDIDGATSGPLTADELRGIDLVMPGDTTPLDGVIMVAGKRTGFGEIAGYYASIGARDAIALDGSDSVMVGSGSTSYLGPLPWYKDGIQKYGFFAQ